MPLLSNQKTSNINSENPKTLNSHPAFVSGQLQFSKKVKTKLLILKVHDNTKNPALLPGFSKENLPCV
jgi:hypothetical protein